jgi:hypothetical protein
MLSITDISSVKHLTLTASMSDLNVQSSHELQLKKRRAKSV